VAEHRYTFTATHIFTDDPATVGVDESQPSVVSITIIDGDSVATREIFIGPQLTKLELETSSSNWQQGFVDQLEDAELGQEGYNLLASRLNATSIGFSGLDQFRLRFAADTAVDQGDLTLIGAATGLVTFDVFNYSSSTFTASWSLNTALADDFYTLRLDLDGDGVAEVYEEFRILTGDVDGDGVLTLNDLLIVQANLLSPDSVRADVDGDGDVDADDEQAVQDGLN